MKSSGIRVGGIREERRRHTSVNVKKKLPAFLSSLELLFLSWWTESGQFKNVGWEKREIEKENAVSLPRS